MDMFNADPEVHNPNENVQLQDPREMLLESLRSIIHWVSERDHSKAVALDSVVHELEVMAFNKGADKLVEVLTERDAAWADLHRIRTIVNNTVTLTEIPTIVEDQAQRDAELAERMTAAAHAEP